MQRIEKSLEKFKELSPVIILTVDSDFVSEKMILLENKYDIKLGSLIVFVAVGDLLMTDIEKYLKIEFALNNDEAKKVNLDLRNIIFTPLLRRLNFLNANKNKEMTIADEMKYIVNMFKGDIVAELNDSPIISDAINARIFLTLSKHLSFKEEIAKELSNNQEVITEKNIKIGKTVKSPIIENWIKDFIKINGSGLFDDLALMKYISNSKNCVPLSDSEKLIVKKVLSTYRNIKFFPESMPSDDSDEWEIIPVERTADDTVRNVPLSTPKTKSEKEIDSLNEEGGKYSEDSLARAVIEEEVGGRSRIEELKIELKKYKEGSLERMSIEEEIKKLEH